ncbi:MAG: hypothetical protein KFB96_14720 [Thiocapsa sp.]|uniref:hypothetical protein n=1 Tax=Thiocapsa sp. TaxID=2024551 RepID=UPI001BCE0327|nr:hypothetical protein [Thiocapsa sp.]QVL46992.1 MAG: hypothetical protein KFB96_14720 [Thiocapsa sp.]
MDQPLSYQTLPSSCWVTSVINGLLFLYRDKNKIPGFVLRLLHSVLTDEGVYSSGPSKADWEIVLNAIAQRCNMKIRSFSEEDAEQQLENVDFSKSVVVCDIGAGTHSVLINKKIGDWYYGFDPDWDSVKANRHMDNEYELFPQVNERLRGKVNFKVHKTHLFNQRATRNRKFAMGAVSKRNITVISKA